MSSYDELASHGLPNRGRGYMAVQLHEWMERKELYRGKNSKLLLDAISQANFPEINRAFTGDPAKRPTDLDMRRAMVTRVLKELLAFNAAKGADKPDSLEDIPLLMWKRLSRSKHPVPALTEKERTDVREQLADHTEDFNSLSDVQQKHLAAFLDRKGWPEDGLGQYAMKIIAMMTELPVTQVLTLPKDKYAMREFEFEPTPSPDDPGSTGAEDTGAAGQASTSREPPRLMLMLDATKPWDKKWAPIFRDAVDPKQSSGLNNNGQIVHVGKTIPQAVGAEVDRPEIARSGDCLYDSLALMAHIQDEIRNAPPVKKWSLGKLKPFTSAAPAGGVPSAQDVKRELARRAIEWLSEQDIPDLYAQGMKEEDRTKAQEAAEQAAIKKGQAGDQKGELAYRFSTLTVGTPSTPPKKLNVPEWKGTDLEKKFESLTPAQKEHVHTLLAKSTYQNETTDMAPLLVALLFKFELKVFSSSSEVQRGERIPMVTESSLGAPRDGETSALPRGLLSLEGEHYSPMLLKAPVNRLGDVPTPSIESPTG